MDNVQFPPQITNALLGSEKAQGGELKSALQDEKVRRAFLQWSRSHSEWVRCNPLIQNIHSIVEGDTVAATATKIKTLLGVYHLSEDLEEIPQATEDQIENLLCYADVGVIDSERVIEYLRSVDLSKVAKLSHASQKHLVKLLSTTSTDGDTLLHSDDVNTLRPLLSLLDPSDLNTLLNRRCNGNNPLNYASNETILGLFTKLNRDQITQLLLNRPYIVMREGIKDFLPFLANLTDAQMWTLFTHKDDQGRTLAHLIRDEEDLVLWDQLEIDKWANIMSLPDNSGLTPIHGMDTDTARQVLDRLTENPKSLWSVLRPSSDRPSLIHRVARESLLKVLRNVPEATHRYELLISRDEHGKGLLHHYGWGIEFPNLVKALLHDKLGLSSEQLFRILTRQDSEGKAAICYADFDDIPAFLKKIPQSDHASVVKLLLSHRLLDEDKFFNSLVVSDSWMTKPKSATGGQLIPKQDYKKRAKQMIVDMTNLWKSLKFVASKDVVQGVTVSEALLDGKSPDKFWNAISVMLNRVASKEAWLGTPRAEDIEALHAFYSSMLLNCESIVKHLQQKNAPHITAGTLMSFACPQLEGRCAAAYQEEIAQVEETVSGRETSAIESIPKVIFQRMIDDFIRKKGGGDVHALARLRYAAGLISHKDPLSGSWSVEWAFRELRLLWTLEGMMKYMAEYLPRERAMEYFSSLTPERALPEMLKIITKTKSEETLLYDAIYRDLSRVFPAHDADNISTFIKYSIDVSLAPLIPFCRTFIKNELTLACQQLFDQTLKKLGLNISFNAELFQDVLKDPSEFQNQVIRSIPASKKLTVMNATHRALGQLKAIENFDRYCTLQDFDKSEQRLAILKSQADYRQKLEALIQRLQEDPVLEDWAFESTTYTLPSQSIEAFRRSTYNKRYFESATPHLMYKRILFFCDVLEIPR